MKVNKKLFLWLVVLGVVALLLRPVKEGFACDPRTKLECQCSGNADCRANQKCESGQCTTDFCKTSYPILCPCSGANDCKNKSELFCHTKSGTCRKFSGKQCDMSKANECSPGSFCVDLAPRKDPLDRTFQCLTPAEISNRRKAAFIIFGQKLSKE